MELQQRSIGRAPTQLRARQGGWTGNQALTGSAAQTGITAATTYTLTCNGVGGQAVASAAVTVLAQCSDGIDNDGDGLIDKNDPGCSSPSDNDETDPDTVAPSVTITAPADASTVSGNVTISANASDNVGVAGAKFFANGTQVGTESTTAPYSVTWDSTTVANGAISLTAVARDAAGNATTSGVNVTVNNVAPTFKYVTGTSADGHYFVDQTGALILIKGDSPWGML